MPAERVIRIPNGWRPRHYQMPAWTAVEAGIKRHVLIWHRRAGKDDFALHRAAVSSFQRVGNYWHLLPEASQARKAIWEAVDETTGKRRIDIAFPMEIRETTKEQEMFIRFKTGSTWQVGGSDNYDSMVGSSPVGITFSEYALADPNAWAYLRPILANNGGWAQFITTPRGRNHAAAMYEFAKREPGWFAQRLTVADTGAIPLHIVDQERRELAAERGDVEANAIIQQEYYCSFEAAIPGAYFGEQMMLADQQGRIGEFPWVPSMPVGTAWDLGHGDSTVVWLYQTPMGGRVRLIDVFEGSNVGIDWYAHRLMALPYQLADHIWPHDGAHKDIRDIAGQTLQATAKSLGIKPIRILANDQAIETGINAARNLLPLCEFNTQPIPHILSSGEKETPEQARFRMDRALNALRMYHRKWDDKLKRFADAPLHDWTSHTADAFRYLARGRKSLIGLTSGVNRPTHATM